MGVKSLRKLDYRQKIYLKQKKKKSKFMNLTYETFAILNKIVV